MTRPKMVLKAEDYPWSSAAAHCGLNADHWLSERLAWTREREQTTDGFSWLAVKDNPQDLEVLERNVDKGLLLWYRHIYQEIGKDCEYE